MAKTIEKAVSSRKKKKPDAWAYSGDVIYWIFAEIKNVGTEARDYASSNSWIQLWIKAKRKDSATAVAKRWLAEGGWQFRKRFLISKVFPGYARIGSMYDPPAFTEDEADEWFDHFLMADKQGLDYEFAHYEKPKRNRRKRRV